MNLLELNRRGLIQGPEESDTAFFARSGRAFRLPGAPLSCEIFDIAPDWVGMHFDSKGLRLWEGGCTWIEGGQAAIQLHSAFRQKNYFWGYDRNEIIAHELVHVVRGTFNEPIFEEILAYRTSPSPFRRYWGPIFRSSGEALFSILTLAGCMVAALFPPLQLAALIGLVGLIGGGVVRLVRAQRIFSRALKKMETLVGKEKALPVMLRLTDREITHFSKMDCPKIMAYIAQMEKSHLRWQQITLAYF